MANGLIFLRRNHVFDQNGNLNESFHNQLPRIVDNFKLRAFGYRHVVLTDLSGAQISLSMLLSRPSAVQAGTASPPRRQKGPALCCMEDREVGEIAGRSSKDLAF